MNSVELRGPTIQGYNPVHMPHVQSCRVVVDVHVNPLIGKLSNVHKERGKGRKSESTRQGRDTATGFHPLQAERCG